jgi:iron complex outermembrane receptor protein
MNTISRRGPPRRARRACVPAAASACIFSLVAQAQTGTPSGSPPTAQSAQAATIEVVGRRQAGAYHAGQAAGAKSDLPLRELPQSVRVVTRQAIDDLGATKLDDVLDYVGGVSRQNNFGGLWDNIAIRGLPGDQNVGMATLFNGMAAGRGFNAPRDLAGVERIEFLKGSAAALYGSSEPGGTLNIVSKRPLWQMGHAAELYLGSFGLRRAALDSSGPLGVSFAYRLNAAVERRDSFRDHVGARRDVVAPAFTWRLSPASSLDYRGEALSHRTPLDRGVVSVDGRLDAIPRTRFLGEPADGDVTVKNQTHQLVLTHAWSEQWRSRIGLSYRETSINGFSTEPHALQANGLLTRQRRFRDYQSDDIGLQAELQGTLRAGGVEHEVLVGVESYRFELDSVVLRANPTTANPYAIDIYNPVYGQPQPVPPLNVSTLEQQRNTALYLQDAIKLAPAWRLVAGVRVDNYRQSTVNRRSGVTLQQAPTATSPRLGLSWLPSSQWSVYLNAGRSFRPNVGTDVLGTSFEPEQGRALELGTKWESQDRRLGVTAAVFHIRKRNVLTSDPANPGFSIATGEVTSRGAELDLSGQISQHWRLNASLVHNEVLISKDNTLPAGSRLLNSPRINGSLLAVYEGELGAGQRFGVGGGVTHVGNRVGQAGDPSFLLPGYTTAKLVAHWRLNAAYRLTLDVDNLFDRTHYTSSFSRLWVTPGTARNITLGLQARF